MNLMVTVIKCRCTEHATTNWTSQIGSLTKYKTGCIQCNSNLKWQTSTICRFYYTFHPTTMLWNSNSESSSTFFSQKDQISHQSSNKKANKNMRLIQIFEPHDAITTLPSRYRSLIASCRRTSAAHEVGRRRTRGRGVRWAGPVRDQDLGGWSLVSLDLGWMKHGEWWNLRKGCWKYHCLLWVKWVSLESVLHHSNNHEVGLRFEGKSSVNSNGKKLDVPDALFSFQQVGDHWWYDLIAYCPPPETVKQYES